MLDRGEVEMMIDGHKNRFPDLGDKVVDVW